MQQFKSTRMGKTLLIVMVISLIPLLSGCSLSTLTDKVFGKAKALSDLPANAVYVDQQADKAVTDLINSAQKTIYLEQYTIDRKDLMNLLINKAKQGVEVKVLIDQAPSSAKSTYDFLRANGVDVHYYPTERGQFTKAKLLSVDNTRALLSGNDWTEAAKGNHDVALALDGKSGWKAAWIFARDWKFATTLQLQVGSPDLPEDNIVLATNSNVLTLITSGVQGAQATIQIEVNQLTYPPEVINALADFAASGKQVQIILDASSEQSEKYTISKLLGSGVEVRLFPSDAKHQLTANFAVFDGSSTLLGSANWTHSSFVQNHELDAQVPSPAVSQRLAQQFKEDWSKAKVSDAKPIR